jgi:serine/threonine protein kinase
MLKKFSNPSHEHLISLLATYEQFKTFFLIFHWADADLQRYWRDVNPTPSMDRETVIWVAKQCKGVADGIVTIHQYRTSSSKLQVQPQNEVFGHHGDIKPENVLWFADTDHEQTKRGTLKLSDFGLAEFSMHNTRSMNPKSSFATSPPYRAPEVDLEGTGAIGRSYDIWTLGCLYLEFITWLIGGWDLVDDFSFRRMEPDHMLGHDTRTFFKLVKIKAPDGKYARGAEIKPVVKDVSQELLLSPKSLICLSHVQFINELYSHESCTKFLRDFLDMVRDDLLVIQTHDRETRGRPTSQEVRKKLGDMLRNCEDDESYACKSAPHPFPLKEKVMEGSKSKGYLYIDYIDLPEATGSPM